MKSPNVNRMLQRGFRRMRHRYNNLLEDFDREEIHGFRVEVKKMRAWLRLLNANQDKESAIKLGDRLKTFYRVTGNIRNLQLQQRQIFTFCEKLRANLPMAYLAGLKHKEEEQRMEARKQAFVTRLDKTKKKILTAAGKIHEPPLQEFIYQVRHLLIEALSSYRYDDDQLHDIRKRLKDIMYCWTLLGSYLQIALPYTVRDKKNLELLTEKLGYFQDMCIALRFFSPSYIELIQDASEREAIQKIKAFFEQQKYRQKEEVIAMIRSRLNYANNECRTMNKRGLPSIIHSNPGA